MNITKNKLLDALGYLGRFPEKSLKKDELLLILNRIYEEEIDEIVNVINNKIYDLLKRLVQANEKGIDVNIKYEAEVDYLDWILVIEEPIFDENNIHIKFSEGMKDKFKKFINTNNENKVKRTHKIAKLIINIVDVYGLIEDYEVLNRLNKLLDYKIDMNFMYMLLYNQIDLRNDIILGDYEDKIYLISSLVEKPEEIISERESKDTDIYYKEYTKEELEKSVIDNLIDCKEARKLIDFLKKRKIKYTTEIVSSMIIEIMNMSSDYMNNIKKLMKIELDNIDEANEYLKLIMKLYNNILHYGLYGYSPDELFKIQMLELQKEEELKKKQKIGRNEPCPCGSGRKYKHCCMNKVIKVDFRNIQYDDCVKKEEGILFFNLKNLLFNYTNQKYRINNELESLDDICNAETEEITEIREKLWSDKNIIIEYTLKNPDNLDSSYINIIRNWNEKKIKKEFILYKYEKEYTILMDDNYIYYIKGLKESIRNMIPENELPTFVNTVLLPLNGKIIYDSIINQYDVSFGQEFRDECDRNYKILLKQNKVKYEL